jgi:predicted NUDIX family phosphoesterase
MSEAVLVFRSNLLNEIGSFQGYTLDTERYLSAIFDTANHFFISRSIAEQDQRYKQIIPYVSLRHKNLLLSYVRGAEGGGEQRLAGLRSIGFGGHIEPFDRLGALTGRELYLFAMERELREEVSFGTPCKERIVALLNEDTTPVGRVHFGILHLIELTEPTVAGLEQGIADIGFFSIGELKTMFPQLERWSQIALQVFEKVIEP